HRVKGDLTLHAVTPPALSAPFLPPVLPFFSSRRRYTILVSDWSSDVCSSDLLAFSSHQKRFSGLVLLLAYKMPKSDLFQIGRASCRERVKISEVAVSLKKM